jgi:hypothetical protein
MNSIFSAFSSIKQFPIDFSRFNNKTQYSRSQVYYDMRIKRTQALHKYQQHPELKLQVVKPFLHSLLKSLPK